MRTSDEIYHRVRWDARFDPARFTVGVMQRGAAPKRVPLPAFVPGGDVPWHRVLFFEADGEVVWDRATGVDRIDATAAGRVREARLLRSPFFTARRPYAWDPAAARWEPCGGPGGGAGGGAGGGLAAGGGAVAVPAVTGLRVLTWNTLWDRYDSDRIDTARRRPLLLEALRGADADVIALQEVEAELLGMLLAAPWVRRGYTVSTDPGGRDVGECGLLLLSRVPVRETAVHVLGPHKAVAAVVLETGAVRPPVVAVTHLSSDHSQDGAGRRAVELARLAEGLAGVDADVVLAGDVNDGGDLPQTALGMRDAWSEVHGPDDRTPTFDPGRNPLAAVSSLSGRASRLDRVLLRGEGLRADAAVLAGDAPGPEGLFVSDHYGVVVDLTVDASQDTGSGSGSRSGSGSGSGSVSGSVDSAGAGTLDVGPTVRTAVAWLPPRGLWPELQDVRREHDPGFLRWPPHVNLLFGFVPEAEFERAAELVAQAVREVAPFDARLQGVHSFGHGEDAAVWLDPAAGGEAPWGELRRALERRFPRCRGTRSGFTPHLTLARTGDAHALAASLEARVGGSAARVGHVALLSRRGDEPMRVRATVALGSGQVRWRDDEPPGAEPAGAEPADRESADPGPVEVEPDPWADPALTPAGADPDAAHTAHAAPAAHAPRPGRAARVARLVAEALPEGAVHVVGSRRMGCALPGADLDLVAALPGDADLADVRARVTAALPGARHVREVVGARVPGLRLTLRDVTPAPGGAGAGAGGGTPRAAGPDPAVDGSADPSADLGADLVVDLVVVATGAVPPGDAVARRAELDAAAAVALSAVSDADAVLAEVGDRRAAFAGLAREVKRWARARGLDAAPLGGLPGLAWSLLAARTVGEADDLRPTELLRRFFATWAAWDWRVAVDAPGGPGDARPTAPGPLPLTVVTPTHPRRPCTDQVTPGGRDLLTHELYRAWELLEDGGPGGRERLCAPPPLHRRHAAWAVVSVPPGPLEGRVRGRLRALLTALTEAGAPDAHVWPRPFDTGPDVLRYAVGLGAVPPDRAALAAVAGRWLRGLPGVTLTWADGGEVPTLR
ncbi:RNA repair domain-containing protein [Streptomyces kanasensis]|uniref:RNA repair domain-containing protein n=1 Tax=Streptomyces kanasensis TaxID=936756 RepID=UPI0036FEFEA2